MISKVFYFPEKCHILNYFNMQTWGSRGVQDSIQYDQIDRSIPIQF